VGYCLMVAYTYLLQAFDYLGRGESAMARPFKVTDGVGVGFWEAGRGALTHHCVIEDGRLANYQILTPSTWNASPTDTWGQPGPYEEAVLNTPLLEESDDPEKFRGIDVLRAIRSFDPCMPCTTHIQSEAGLITREVNTCACGIDD